jgi:transcriptional regulator with XRE-family HTH domain
MYSNVYIRSRMKAKVLAITAEQLKNIRLNLGETQTQFAKRLGYSSYRTILQKEKGIRSLTFRDCTLLAEYKHLRKRRRTK